MRLAFAGTPSTAADTLRALLATHHDIAFAITRPDAPAGRGRVMTPSPVADLAEGAGVRTIKTATLTGLAEDLSDVDCAVVVAYGALVPRGLLGLPRHGMVNVHYSMLPRWRGAAPVQRAIEAGDAQTGVTVFRLDAGMDTGPILAQRKDAIREQDTAGSLLERLTGIGSEVLLDTLAAIEAGHARAIDQPADGVTLAAKVTTADARIDWSLDAAAVDRHIRAMTPAPGAWCLSGDERLKVGPVTLASMDAALAPGAVEVRGGRVLVGTGTHPVALGHVQRAGRTMGPAHSWASGRTSDLA